MLSTTGEARVIVADGAALLARASAPGREVAVTEAAYTYALTSGGARVTALTVKGLAWGTAQVVVRLEPALVGAALELTAAVAADATRAWEARFDLATAPLPYGMSVRVQARAADAGGEAKTQVDVRLGVESAPGAVLLPAAGEPAGLEAERTRLVAGHADRFVYSRFYVPLGASYAAPTRKDALMVGAHFLARSGDPAAAGRALTRFLSGMRTGERRLQQRVGRFGRALLSAREGLAEVGRAFTNAARLAPARRSSAATPAARSAAMMAAPMLGAPGYGGVGSGGILGPGGLGPDLNLGGGFVPPVIFKLELSWLGVLFYDRLRFRPSGLEAGEQLYALSLAPGEEMELTQRSETKRSVSFEEIVDREEEQELEFSSTWSTDITEQSTRSGTSSVGGNLGTSLSVPIEGASVGLDSGFTTQQASAFSADDQRNRLHEVTTRVTSRAREQHKTTFRVGTDTTREFGTKRALKNANPLHALTLTFYKLYQKHRVLLERHDAKLCVSFSLPDPGRSARAELMDELAKLNPNDTTLYNCPAPPEAEGQAETPPALTYTPWWHEIGVTQIYLPLSITLTPPRAGLKPVNFSARITRWVWRTVAGDEYDAEINRFQEFGGVFRAAAADPDLDTEQYVRLDVTPAGSPFGATVRVEWAWSVDWVPTDAAQASYFACVEAERRRIRASFSAQRVMAMFRRVEAGSENLVFRRVLEDRLLPGYYQPTTGVGDPPAALLDEVRNHFDWNEAVIEYLPWWLTNQGRINYTALRAALLALPGDVATDEILKPFLIAAGARIFLPVRQGHEDAAVELIARPLPGSREIINGYLDEFRAFREANFGPLAHPLPTFDEVLRPDAALATPAGASDWAYAWERPRRRFLVLDEWSEQVPTDGVHIEPSLSTAAGTDAARTSEVHAALQSEASVQERNLSRAALERSLAERADVEIVLQRRHKVT